MLRLAFAALLLGACQVSPAGGPCARHSDCATRYCSTGGTCDTAPADAGTDDADADADTTIPPLDGDPIADAPEEPSDAPPEDAP